MRRADIIVDPAFGQHAELVGAALLDDLQIGMFGPEAGDVFGRLGSLVRTRHGHARRPPDVRAFERQPPPPRDDLVVSVRGRRVGPYARLEKSP